VISTVLLVSGIATILHSYFGTRLPLVQGSSFVYLAPALVVMNSQEFRNLTEHVSELTSPAYLHCRPVVVLRTKFHSIHSRIHFTIG